MPRMTHDQFMANLAVKPPAAIHEKVLNEENSDDPAYLTREERDNPSGYETHHEKYTLPGGRTTARY